MSLNTITESTYPNVSWPQLSHLCQQCINMSISLRGILENKTSNKRLISTLLTQINEQVTKLQKGIKSIATNASEVSQTEAEYKKVIVQMEELMALEKRNHDLVHSQGIPLNIPKTYKYNQHLRD